MLKKCAKIDNLAMVKSLAVAAYFSRSLRGMGTVSTGARAKAPRTFLVAACFSRSLRRIGGVATRTRAKAPRTFLVAACFSRSSGWGGCGGPMKALGALAPLGGKVKPRAFAAGRMN